MKTIIIHSSKIPANQQQQIINVLATENFKAKANHFRAQTNADLLTIKNLSAKLQIDINVIPENFQSENIKLIISDMDSTLISIECIDEIADFVGLKPEVAKITEKAMRGELDFSQSLVQRVKLLQGLDVSALNQVYNERLQLNPGAKQLISGCHALGIKFALVSGGFSFFTEKLKQRLNLDFTLANEFDIVNQKLSGKVKGKIINAQEKRKFLADICQRLNILPKHSIAIGDGANDLQMMSIAGLSVAYCAKPSVQEQSKVQINYSGLDSTLDFLG